MKKTLAFVLLLLLGLGTAEAQWERIENGADTTLPPDTPHPLSFYLKPPPACDPDAALCLFCTTSSGHKITMDDFDIKAPQRLVGEAFGHKILQIDFSFQMKAAVAKETDPENVDVANAAECKTIVVQDSGDKYRRIYLVANEFARYVSPFSDAKLVSVGGTQVLATNDVLNGNGGYHTDGFWVMQPGGPWMLDFTALSNEAKKLTPPDSDIVDENISLDTLEATYFFKPKNANCKVCGSGDATVHFRIEGHRALPISSRFEPWPNGLPPDSAN